MEKQEIKFLGVRKSARCHACHGRGKVVRIGVPDTHHGVMGWSICEKCLGDLVRAAREEKRWPGRKK
ncbi:MAG: hypothetical protein HY694_16265 [Deltaproteobacteria bacterium]|nr:hypothetical protein [Deltaproteobacteria bacterium]